MGANLGVEQVLVMGSQLRRWGVILTIWCQALAFGLPLNSPEDRRQGQKVRSQQDIRRIVLRIGGDSFEDDCMRPHNHVLNGL